MLDQRICKIATRKKSYQPVQCRYYLIQYLGREIKADELIKKLLSQITVHRPRLVLQRF